MIVERQALFLVNLKNEFIKEHFSKTTETSGLYMEYLCRWNENCFIDGHLGNYHFFCVSGSPHDDSVYKVGLQGVNQVQVFSYHSLFA